MEPFDNSDEFIQEPLLSNESKGKTKNNENNKENEKLEHSKDNIENKKEEEKYEDEFEKNDSSLNLLKDILTYTKEELKKFKE